MSDWDWWWNINNNISFHFRLFPRKTKLKIVQISKKPYFGAILGPFCSNLDKKEFSWKNGSDIFLIFKLSTIVPKIKKKKTKKKTNEWFLRKMLNRWRNKWTDRWTDRWTDNGDFVGPFIGWESNNNDFGWLS